MNYLRIYSGISLLTILFLSSCKDHNEYRVNSAFADYLQRFENEGAARGRTFDLKSTGLIIEFATLKDNTAGLTHYEDPIRIEIDQTYWDAISKTAGADLMKEDLIFHELGHGLLGRKHINTTLENNDWKSIMCGGDKVDDRSWNINYRGERRAYYINELFDESTPTPDFSSMQLAADTTGYITKIKFSFDTEAQSGWKIVNNDSCKTSIDNGRLRFQSKINKELFVLAKAPIDILSNFSYQLTFEYLTGDSSNQYGLAFGTNTSTIQSIEYFSINNNQKMFMGNTTWYSFYTELFKSQIVSAGKNTMRVVRINSMIYYFINSIYSYCSEIEATGSGDYFGFMVPAMGTIYIDNFIISQKGSANVSSKVKSNQPIEFSIKTITNFNQNKINNQ